MAKPIAGIDAIVRQVGKIPTGRLEWWTGKRHVGESGLRIAREVRKMTAGWPWAMRRAAMRYAIKCHLQNRGIYRAVVTGRF